jgi:hypothetical protein
MPHRNAPLTETGRPNGSRCRTPPQPGGRPATGSTAPAGMADRSSSHPFGAFGAGWQVSSLTIESTMWATRLVAVDQPAQPGSRTWLYRRPARSPLLHVASRLTSVPPPGGASASRDRRRCRRGGGGLALA